jgi:hypothetical protein
MWCIMMGKIDGRMSPYSERLNMIKNPNKHNKENMTAEDKMQIGDLVWVDFEVNSYKSMAANRPPVSQRQYALCTIIYIPHNLGEVWRLWGNGQEYLEYYWNMCSTYNNLLMEHPEGLSMLGLPSDYWQPLFQKRAQERSEIGGSSSD